MERRSTIKKTDPPLIRLRDRVAEQEYKFRSTPMIHGDFRVPRAAALLCRRLWMGLPELQGTALANEFNRLRPSQRAQQAIAEVIGQLGVSRYPDNAAHLVRILLHVAKQMVEAEIQVEGTVAADTKVMKFDSSLQTEP